MKGEKGSNLNGAWNKGLTKKTDERVRKMYPQGLNKPCPICKKEFYVQRHKLNSQKTCSKECSNGLMSINMKGKMPKNINSIKGWNKGLKSGEEVRCYKCNEKVYVYIINLKMFKTHFCSLKCKYGYEKENPIRSGKKHTQKSLRRIAEKSREMWANPKIRQKLEQSWINKRGISDEEIITLFEKGLSLKTITSKTKVTRPAIKKVLLQRGFTVEDIQKNANKIIGKNTKKHRKYQIFPKKDTSIEVKIQNFLKELGIEYFTHQYMKIEHGYQCDVLIPSMNLVIECDGNYWHKYPVGLEKDHLRTKELIEKGFKVLRLWESEIRIMDLSKFEDEIQIAKSIALQGGIKT